MGLVAAGSLLIWLLSVLSGSFGFHTPSFKLIHRFSPEMVVTGWNEPRPEKRSMQYYRLLRRNDVERQKMRLNRMHSLLFPSEGSQTMSLGNDFGWLHYTWIDIGSPHTSFLVALDTGSDLLWVPCNCVQCAPLSASYYSSLDRDLSEYVPSRSSSSKYVSCSHRLCEAGSKCSNPKQPCPYNVQYFSENTSTSGVLIQDVLHLSSGTGASDHSTVQATVIIGCGMRQTGGYLDGVAPDGLMGLGLKETSVPSFLSRGGFMRNSFSLCFDEADSGRIFFGDEGPSNQQSTSLLDFDGSYKTYAVGVEAVCIGKSCQKSTNFTAFVDSGTSFTLLPQSIYDQVAKEFDRQINASIASFDEYSWSSCYKTSTMNQTKIPSMSFTFEQNNTFEILNPVFMIYGMEGVTGFCLAIQPTDSDVGTIGQNFMTGYRMVYDRENMRLGWSRSDCDDVIGYGQLPVNGTANSLPTYEQQSTHAVAPAVAGRTPTTPSAAAPGSGFTYSKLATTLLVLIYNLLEH